MAAAYCYRFQLAQHASFALVAGLATGLHARDALANALTARLPDGRRVGDALTVPRELLHRAPDSPATEVAFKHGGIFVSLVAVAPTGEDGAVVLRAAELPAAQAH